MSTRRAILTKLYNHPDFWTPAAGAIDITQATRSIVCWKNDTIVVYDRATSLHPGLFKRFNLCLTTSPTVSGNTATETLASGQQLFVQTLLPPAPALSVVNGAAKLNPIAQLEPTRYVYTVQDPAPPTDTRFLHVLQGADSGAAMVPAVYTQSVSGAAFDGAEFGGSAVYFPVSAAAPVTVTTFAVSAGVHTLLIAGLTAGASYGVAIQSGAVTVTPGGAGYSADSAGLLEVTF